jgi:hypothetical protein
MLPQMGHGIITSERRRIWDSKWGRKEATKRTTVELEIPFSISNSATNWVT